MIVAIIKTVEIPPFLGILTPILPLNDIKPINV